MKFKENAKKKNKEEEEERKGRSLNFLEPPIFEFSKTTLLKLMARPKDGTTMLFLFLNGETMLEQTSLY